jgi:hypothetical protein
VIGEPLDVLSETVGIEPLDAVDHRRVEGATALVQQARIRHVVGQRVGERVFQLGIDPRLEQELGVLELCEPLTELAIAELGDRGEQRERHVTPDHRRLL